MTDDSTLLRRFADDRSEPAFAELVQRHLNLVYSAALRTTAGDTHLARDVSQTVFAALARDARRLSGHPVLPGWLYTAAHFTAAKAVRTERRRRAREQEALAMSDPLPASVSEVNWTRLRPALDAAMQKLGPRDRDAVLLRYFENRSFAEVGARLGLTGNAARMRVDRALDKLHALLARRGITSTTAALAVLLTENAVTAAPAGLTATISSAALVGAAAGGGGALALWGFMSTPKVLAAVTGVAAVAVGVGVILQQQTTAALRAEAAGLQVQADTVADLRAENQRLARLQVPPAALDQLRADRIELEHVRAEVAALRERLASLVPRASPSTIPPSWRGDPTYDLRQLDEIPKATLQVPPVYPLPMLFDGSAGEVVVGFVVDVDGNVGAVEVLRSSDPAFNDSATAAVKKWKFTPGKKAGQAVNTRMSVPIVFAQGDLPPARR